MMLARLNSRRLAKANQGAKTQITQTKRSYAVSDIGIDADKNKHPMRGLDHGKGGISLMPEPLVPEDITAPVLLPKYLLNANPTKITTLDNNVRVATEDGEGETATIGIWIDAGSVYENDSNNGTAHFLEHMAFKGTATRSQSDIEETVENLGASLNAYTSREQTVYVARCFKDHVPQMMDILADILQNSKYDEKDIERERSVILKEKEVVEQNTDELLFDYVHDGAFQSTPLQRTILGPVKNIQNINKNDLQSFVDTHYTGDRMVVSAAGAVKHEEIVELANKKLNKIKPTSSFDIKTLDPTFWTGSEIVIRDDLMSNIHAIIAWEGVGWSHPDYFVFLVLQAMIGVWDKSMGAGHNTCSHLVDNMYREHLAVGLSAFNTCYNDTGIFGIQWEVPGEGYNGDFSANRVVNEMGRISRINLDPGELQRAKSKVWASALMNLDGSYAVAEDIGRNVLALGRRMSPSEVAAKIQMVSADDIKRVADEHFYDSDPTVVAMGPTFNWMEYAKIRAWTRWKLA